MIIETLGWVGAVLYVVAYALVAIRKIESNSKMFNGLNLLGAMGVGVAAVANSDTPSIALNAVWGLIALGVLVFG